MSLKFARMAIAIVCAVLTMGCGGGGGGGSSGGSGGGSGGGSSPPPPPPSVVGDGPFIVVDQFGYLPNSEKIAVIRDPVSGFDSNDAFTPGSSYQVISVASGSAVLTGAPSAWNNGAIDTTSGDHAWQFDFSLLTTPGEYYVHDVQRNVNSARFTINANVYRPILAQAVRMLFYQRAGQVKAAQYVGAGWADGASHMGPLQDTQTRRYNAPNDASTERDLRGGWYDAGDYNKYTNWTGDYVVRLMHAYVQNPSAWGDDYNLPHSGNGVADVLDEVKWGLDWLVRMQESDGSVLSIVGESHASPPSSATGQSLYGTPSTSSTLSAAAAYAYGAKVFGGVSGMSAYASDLRQRAIIAWTWAQAHPNVIFRNNEAASGTEGLGAGQQEVDDYGRAMKGVVAAIYLFDLTGEATYRAYVDAHYQESSLIRTGWTSPFEEDVQRPLLYYASLSNATSGVASAIRTAYTNGWNGVDGWGAISSARDPYGSYITNYTWGSNGVKARAGAMFAAEAFYNFGGHTQADALNAASRYVHYIHGVNPLGKVYLSNMANYGAENSVDTFYHTWFADGSALWDSVKTSTYGPPPGYLVGGATTQYDWDSRCPTVSSACGAARLSPPYGQPAQKSYLDFNTSWPLNSWIVTEPSIGYQSDYILLLARFVS